MTTEEITPATTAAIPTAIVNYTGIDDLKVGEEQVLSSQEEAEQMLKDLREVAAPIRRAYKQNEQKIKDAKRAIRKRQNNARQNARRSARKGR